MSGWRGFCLGVSALGLALSVTPADAIPGVTFWTVCLLLDVVLAVSEAKGWKRST